MKSRIATLMAAVLATAQPVAGQIGQEIDERPPAQAPDTGVVRGDVAARPVALAQPGDSVQQVHVVRRGDTLWDLAGFYYQNPFAWPTIHRANTDVVEDPHWIYPEERLVIPGRMTAVAEGPPFAPGRITELPAPADPERRTRFYRADEEAADPAIIAAEALRRAGVQPGEHYSAPWLADPPAMPVLGRVVRSVAAPNTGFEDDVLIHPFDDVYVEYRDDAVRPEPGEKMLLVKVGERVRGTERVIRPAGIGRVIDTSEDVMTVRVTEQWGLLRDGDLALPLRDFPAIEGDAQAISGGPIGEILHWELDQPLYGTSDLGFADIGRADGVQVGDVMLVYRQARQRGSTDLPAEPVAYVKVVRADEATSTFRVTKVLQRRLESGLPVQVVSRIP